MCSNLLWSFGGGKMVWGNVGQDDKRKEEKKWLYLHIINCFTMRKETMFDDVLLSVGRISKLKLICIDSVCIEV